MLTPINNIIKIKQIFLQKVLSTTKKCPKATHEEFTLFMWRTDNIPGDVVYSSSNFLSSSLPRLKIEKLLTL